MDQTTLEVFLEEEQNTPLRILLGIDQTCKGFSWRKIKDFLGGWTVHPEPHGVLRILLEDGPNNPMILLEEGLNTLRILVNDGPSNPMTFLEDQFG